VFDLSTDISIHKIRGIGSLTIMRLGGDNDKRFSRIIRHGELRLVKVVTGNLTVLNSF